MVSGSGLCARQVVVDARHHMLGRLTSVIAKELLNGQQFVVVLCEEIAMSAGLVRQKMKYLRFLRKRMNTKPSHGPIRFRAPSKILWRTIRGYIIRLAFGPENLLPSVIIKARKDLGLFPSSAPASPFSRFPFSQSSSFNEKDLINSNGSIEFLSFLNEQNTTDSVYNGWEQSACSSPDGFGWKLCLYYQRGFCKNGSACRFLHGPVDDTSSSVEQELMLMRSKSQRLAASAAAFPYSPTGSSSNKCFNFMLQQQHNESQRAAAVALLLESENQKFIGRARLERSDFAGMVNPSSRQIYLTFPTDSTFREEDVSNYFRSLAAAKKSHVAADRSEQLGRHDASSNNHKFDTEDDTFTDLHIHEDTPTNVVLTRNSGCTQNAVGHMVREFEQEKKGFEDDARFLVEAISVQSLDNKNQIKELRKLKVRFVRWMKDYKVKLRGTKAKLRNLGKSEEVKTCKKWWSIRRSK